VACAILGFVPSPGAAQVQSQVHSPAPVLGSASPEEVGFLPQRLERIGREIERSIADGELPGAVALVVRDGKVVYQEAFGYADLASKTPMRVDTIFRIASMTKPITTVGVMMLYEEGHFRLNDPVSEFLPEFTEMRVISEMNEDGTIAETVPAKRPIRIIDLLSHASGLSYPFNPDRLQKTYRQAGIVDSVTASDTVLAEQVRLIAAQPLLFEPGSGFRYSLATDVLGRLIEVVSGQSLDRFFFERIFEPLGMVDTYFYLPESEVARLATLYAHVDERGLVVSQGDESEIKLDNPNFPVEGARSHFSGGAGLSSTVNDYARFAQMLLNEGQLGGVRLVGRKSVELMRTARVDWDDDQLPDFSIGFQVVGDLGVHGELGSVGSYFWGGAFYTSFWIDPRERLVGLLMSQARPSRSDLRQKFPTLVYQALE
jgi:CubicO group peptidase (beta-lactamase class C family)